MLYSAWGAGWPDPWLTDVLTEDEAEGPSPAPRAESSDVSSWLTIRILFTVSS